MSFQNIEAENDRIVSSFNVNDPVYRAKGSFSASLAQHANNSLCDFGC